MLHNMSEHGISHLFQRQSTNVSVEENWFFIFVGFIRSVELLMCWPSSKFCRDDFSYACKIDIGPLVINIWKPWRLSGSCATVSAIEMVEVEAHSSVGFSFDNWRDSGGQTVVCVIVGEFWCWNKAKHCPEWSTKYNVAIYFAALGC